jgi:hypothetical protein
VIAKLIRRVVPERFRPIGYLTHLVQSRTGCQVRQGPFAEMRYVTNSVGSAYLPKLLGLYERELSECIDAIIRREPELIIDIGAGEGYYAVGLALRSSATRVIAFEMQAAGQRAIAEMSLLNGVADRVEVRGKCELPDIVNAIGSVARPVVVCDVEGYEKELLCPEIATGLRRTSVLVEVHEFVVRGISDELKRRFAGSHSITEYWQLPRARAEFPWRTVGTMLLPNSYLDWAVSEWRPERMSWLWMEPKN